MDCIKKENIILLFPLIYFILGSTTLLGQETNLVASCCKGKTGRCTGSSYCTACKTCNYCKYCNNGGSCGVCSGGSRRTTTRTYTPRPKTTYPSTYRSSSKRKNTANSYWNNKNTNQYTNSESIVYNLPNDMFSKYYLKTLMVNTIALNLRVGPGTEYVILERLNKYQELIFLAMTENWVKVRVKSTNTIGFVHNKYVVVVVKE